MREVYRWRGSPEQRATRSEVRKLGQFSYFDQMLDHPAWGGKNVLDFGGNDGNLLRNPDCRILPADYYCIDVVAEALEEGRAAFPDAHWVHYDRYNCSFNPGGQPDLALPDLDVEFDFILAYSVFTHTTREDMVDLVKQLQAHLAPGGALAFTFEDPHFEAWPGLYHGNNLKWRLERSLENHPDIDVERLVRNGRGADWCSVVDGHLYVNSNGVWRNDPDWCVVYDVFHTVEFMRREFPDAAIRPPVNGEMQHCCVIRRRA